MDKIIAIYSITNVKNGKIYVGSTKDFNKRYYLHLLSLRNNKHYNLYLQRAFNKDGENSFSYGLLEKCNNENLIEREEYYIKKLKACDIKFGYNMNPRGDRPPSWKNKKHKEETKEKIKQWNKGKKISDYVKKRASETHKGKKISEEQKLFLKENFKGEKNPMYGKRPYDIWLEKYGKDEADKKLKNWKEKISIRNTGRITSEETKLKISKSNTGKKQSKEAVEKIKLNRIGKKASEETRIKLSLKRTGELNPSCKIKDVEIPKILKMIEGGESIKNISILYDVSSVTIRNIKKGKRKT